jgi:hypothetical protein
MSALPPKADIRERARKLLSTTSNLGNCSRRELRWPTRQSNKLSNKIIQKGLAFRCDRSATVLASGALLLLRDRAPPA